MDDTSQVVPILKEKCPVPGAEIEEMRRTAKKRAVTNTKLEEIIQRLNGVVV